MGLRTSTFEFFFPGAAARRALRRPARFDIEGFPSDRIGKVIGVVEAAETGEIISPLTETRCVAYHLRVFVTALDNVGWYPALSTAVGVPFTVQDTTGAARVITSGAEMDLDSHLDTMSGFPSDKIHTIGELLRIFGLGFAGWVRPERLEFADIHGRSRHARLRIGLLEVGELAAVSGRGQHEPILDPKREVGYRAEPATQLVFRSHRRTPMYVSDRRRLTLQT